MKKYYTPVRNAPFVKFYYKGSHSHPIRRTILRIPSLKRDDSILVGYELREGNTVRTLANAPIKSYKKSKIAKYGELGSSHHRNPGEKKTTMRCMNYFEFMKSGV